MTLLKCCMIGVASVMGLMLAAFLIWMLLSLVSTMFGNAGALILLGMIAGCALGVGYWLHSKGA